MISVLVVVAAVAVVLWAMSPRKTTLGHRPQPAHMRRPLLQPTSRGSGTMENSGGLCLDVSALRDVALPPPSESPPPFFASPSYRSPKAHGAWVGTATPHTACAAASSVQAVTHAPATITSSGGRTPQVATRGKTRVGASVAHSDVTATSRSYGAADSRHRHGAWSSGASVASSSGTGYHRTHAGPALPRHGLSVTPTLDGRNNDASPLAGATCLLSPAPGLHGYMTPPPTGSHDATSRSHCAPMHDTSKEEAASPCRNAGMVKHALHVSPLAGKVAFHTALCREAAAPTSNDEGAAAEESAVPLSTRCLTLAPMGDVDLTGPTPVWPRGASPDPRCPPTSDAKKAMAREERKAHTAQPRSTFFVRTKRAIARAV